MRSCKCNRRKSKSKNSKISKILNFSKFQIVSKGSVLSYFPFLQNNRVQLVINVGHGFRNIFRNLVEIVKVKTRLNLEKYKLSSFRHSSRNYSRHSPIFLRICWIYSYIMISRFSSFRGLKIRNSWLFSDPQFFIQIVD